MVSSPIALGSGIIGAFTTISLYFFAAKNGLVSPSEALGESFKPQHIAPIIHISNENYSELSHGTWLLAMYGIIDQDLHHGA
jgi:hypothetical protein